MILRTQRGNIEKWIGKGKAVIVMGARQVGKRSVSFPKSFMEAYPESETLIIDKNNFETFVGLE